MLLSRAKPVASSPPHPTPLSSLSSETTFDESSLSNPDSDGDGQFRGKKVFEKPILGVSQRTPSLSISESASSTSLRVGEDERTATVVRSGSRHPRMDYERFLVKPMLKASSSKVLGAGNSGPVYFALMPSEAPAVVRKLLIDEGLREQEAFEKKRFSLSRLSHPNLIRIYGYAIDCSAVVIEYAEYGSLSQMLDNSRMRGKKLVRELCLDYSRQVLRGLYHIHMHGIRHDNLKSANVLIAAGGLVVKVCDLWEAGTITKHNWLEKACLEAGRPALETLCHTAPECFAGEVSPYSDMYAYAVLCWELWTQGALYGEHETNAIIKEKILANILRYDLGLVNDPNFHKIIDMCWNADVASRPRTDAVLKLINPWCDAAPVRTHHRWMILDLLDVK